MDKDKPRLTKLKQKQDKKRERDVMIGFKLDQIKIKLKGVRDR